MGDAYPIPPFGTVLRNEATGCRGVAVMVVRWMEPMFIGLVLDDGHEHGAWGWESRNGGPGTSPGWLGLVTAEGKAASWEAEAD